MEKQEGLAERHKTGSQYNLHRGEREERAFWPQVTWRKDPSSFVLFLLSGERRQCTWQA